jgi:hypothetical protein
MNILMINNKILSPRRNLRIMTRTRNNKMKLNNISQERNIEVVEVTINLEEEVTTTHDSKIEEVIVLAEELTERPTKSLVSSTKMILCKKVILGTEAEVAEVVTIEATTEAAIEETIEEATRMIVTKVMVEMVVSTETNLEKILMITIKQKHPGVWKKAALKL